MSQSKQESKLICRLCDSSQLELAKTFEEATWYFCQDCFLLQKHPLREDFTEDFKENNWYNAERQFPDDARYRSIIKSRASEWQYYERYAQLSTPYKVLDFGSGDGALISYLNEKGNDAIGIELSKKCVAFCEEKKIPVLSKKIEQCDFDKGSFDVIHLRNSMDMIANLGDVVDRFRVILKPKGYLFIHGKQFTWNGCFSLKTIARDRAHASYFSSQTIRSLCALKGFKIISYRNIFGSFHLVAQKTTENQLPLKGSLLYDKLCFKLLPALEPICFVLRKILLALISLVRR